MDTDKYDSQVNMSYQLTMSSRPSYYVEDTPVTLDIPRLQQAIDAPRHTIAKEQCDSVESIRNAILALVNSA